MRIKRVTLIIILLLTLAGCGACDNNAEMDFALNNIKSLTQNELSSLYRKMEQFLQEVENPYYSGTYNHNTFKKLNHDALKKLKPRGIRIEGRQQVHLYVRMCGLDLDVLLSFYFDAEGPYGRSIQVSRSFSATEVEGETIWPKP